MSRKGSADISEKLRKVNIHKFRFAKFLRYLKDANAEIKTVSPLNGETIVYKSNASKNESTLENLVSDALGVKDGYARDLVSRKLSMDDKHYNKERLSGLGDILNDIVVQKQDSQDEVSDPVMVPIREVSYKYYRRKGYKKYPNQNLSEISSLWLTERNKKREFTVRPKLKHLLQRHIDTLISGFVSENDIISRVAGVHFVEFPIFEESIKQLKEFLNDKSRVTKENEAHFELKSELLKLTRVYNEVLDRHDVQNSIIPYYRDFAILSFDEQMGLSIEQFFKYSRKELVEDPELITLRKVIYYRYEILQLLSSNDQDVSDWPVRFQALLMLCNFELEGAHALLNEVIEEELNSLRFTIVTNNVYNDHRVQKDDLTLDSLIEVLSDYNINKPLNEVFQLRDNHILTSAIQKYPEKYAVNYNYTSREVHQKLVLILKEYLRQKLFEGLRITEKICPIHQESRFFI
ncbi:hypothetical protein [Gracilimonas amylolytica]|uniref:hypothetical protein n=1 Tax=Gracilimonas amylolytica TaxID=1749045 RepID=UPI000CD91249|nr:hypothetical protein [Gracilimonas amylolytica]